MTAWSFVPPVLLLAGAPLFAGLVVRTKAIAAGRRGPPLLQLYFDLAKLLRKGAVYSGTTTWTFRAAPVAALAGAGLIAFLLPLGGVTPPLAFPGDVVLLLALLAAMRFTQVLAALDSGSAFTGMGASRELWFGVFVEPALLLAIAALGRVFSPALPVEVAPPASLAAFVHGIGPHAWLEHGPTLALLAGALLLVHLAENARIPFDDPATHLELTMVHEAQLLDHGGPDLAFLLYGAAVKLAFFGALLASLLVPVRSGVVALDLLAGVLGMAGVAVLTGLVESAMARLRLVRVPQLLVAASALAALAAILSLRGSGS